MRLGETIFNADEGRHCMSVENVERTLRNAGVGALDHETLAWRIAIVHPMPENINRLYDDDEVYRTSPRS